MEPFYCMQLRAGVDISGGERGSCLVVPLFQIGRGAPLLIVSHLLFALFCLKADEALKSYL